MKIRIYNWAGDKEVNKIINALGYGHGDIYDCYSVFESVKQFHNLGLNVMLPQAEEGIQTICLDYGKLFTQR